MARDIPTKCDRFLPFKTIWERSKPTAPTVGIYNEIAFCRTLFASPARRLTDMADTPQPIPPLRILVVDDESNIRIQLSLCLEAAGHQVVGHGNIHDALAAASWQVFD